MRTRLAILVSMVLLQAGCLANPADSGDPTLTLLWTYQTDGAINEPPLVVDNVVIALPDKGSVLAFDAQSGDVEWEFDPPQGVWHRAFETDGHQVFVGTGGGTLVALDVANGSLRWQAELGINTQHPPLVAGDVLYVPTTYVGPGLDSDPQGRAELFALAADDGQVLWSFETDNYILQTPSLVGDKLYVAGNFYSPTAIDEGGHMRLYALAADSGALLWTYESEDGFPKRLYATDEAVTFIGYQDFANGVDAASGERLWRRDTGNWVPDLTGAEGVLYFGSANTIVHALDVRNGEVVWEHNIGEGTFNYVLGAPVVRDGVLYFLARNGDVTAVDAHSGDLLWRLPTGIEARAGLTLAEGGLVVIGDIAGKIFTYQFDPAP